MKRIELKERDCRILEMLEVWGALGLGQVEGRFFAAEASDERRTRLFFNEGYRHKGCAYRRMRKLELAGLVKVHRLIGHAQVYGLADGGHKALRDAGRAQLKSHLRQVSSFALTHRLIAAAVGMVMMDFLGFRCRTERQIYVQQRDLRATRKLYGTILIPDMFAITPRGLRAVEVELHPKTEYRYERLWEAYFRRLPDKAALLYLLPTKLSMKGLLRLAEQHYRPFLFALDLPTFRESRGRAPFVGTRGRSLVLVPPDRAAAEESENKQERRVYA